MTNDWLTLVPPEVLEGAFGSVFGIWGTVALLAFGVLLVATALGVLVRGIVDQLRGPAGVPRPTIARHPPTAVRSGAA